LDFRSGFIMGAVKNLKEENKMKNTILSTTMLLFATLLAGCGVIQGSGQVKEETRTVSNFSQVSHWGMGEVYVTQGDEEILRVEAEDNLLPYITTEVKDGTLNIGFKPGFVTSFWPTQPIKFYVTMKNIDGLQTSGSGDISAAAVKTDKLKLSITGSGDISIGQLDSNTLTSSVNGSGDITISQLNAQTVKTAITGSGEMTLAGKVTDQTAQINGSGDYMASELQSQSASVTVTGSGNAEVWAADKVDANISGSGSVKYYGAPSVSQHVSGSGDIASLGAR
jgi:predicted small secreted protein